MATITKPYTFSAGQVIIASEHNSNFDTLYNDYNGNITNANISASAAIVDTKLAQITSAGKVSGAAFTSLPSIPSGAGEIPIANIPTITTAGKVSGAALTSLSSIPGGAGQIPAANLQNALNGETLTLTLQTSKLFNPIFHNSSTYVNFDSLTQKMWDLDLNHGVPAAAGGALAQVYQLGSHMVYSGTAPTVAGDYVQFIGNGTQGACWWLGDGTGAAAADVHLPINLLASTGFVYCRIKAAWTGTADEGSIGIGNDSGSSPTTATPSDAIALRNSGTSLILLVRHDGTGTSSVTIESSDTDIHTLDFKWVPGTLSWWWDNAAQTNITSNIPDAGETMTPYMLTTTTASRGWRVYDFRVWWKYV